MPKIYESVKKSLLAGLKRANYNIDRWTPEHISGGLFSDSTETKIINQSSHSLVKRLTTRIKRGELQTLAEIEKQIDYEAALVDFDTAKTNIRIYMSMNRDASKYVQQAREALKLLERHPDQPIDMHKMFFKKLIGEE